MNPVLEARLEQSFQCMKKKLSLSEQHSRGFVSDLYSAFGCECGDGWYQVLYDLCANITDAYTQAGLQPDIIIDQIKEKYGSLRFCYHHESADGASTPVEIRKAVSRIVEKAEDRSTHICEKCGKSGRLRPELPWIQTFCDSCYNHNQVKP